jgi:hypothetical protein
VRQPRHNRLAQRRQTTATGEVCPILNAGDFSKANAAALGPRPRLVYSESPVRFPVCITCIVGDVEAVRGHPLKPKTIYAFQTVGVVLIFGLMLFAVFGDILFLVRR